MTELNPFHSAGSLPVWALSNAPDMMEWKWQPPKPELWSPQPPPPLSMPALAPLPTPEAVLQSPLQPDPSERAIVDEPQASNIWKCLHDQLHAIRVNHMVSDRVYTDNFWSFMDDFERALSNGDLTGSAATDVYLTAFRDTEIVEQRRPRSARWIRINLMSRLATGVKSARKANRSFTIPSSKFWDLYMLQISQQKPSVRSADLLAFAMANLPSRHGRNHHDIVLKTLEPFFERWHGAELHGEPRACDWREIAQASQMASIWAGRAAHSFRDVEALLVCGEVKEARSQLAIAKNCVARVQRFTLKLALLMSDDSKIAESVANALKAKDPRRHRTLYIHATRLLGDPETNWSRAHYNWLQVMARLPSIKTTHFKRLLELFAPRGHAALSHTEICNLLLLHWESNGKISSDGTTRHIWDQHRGQDDRDVLAALALAVNKSTKPEVCTVIFWGLWDVLRVRAGLRAFLRQLSLLSYRGVLSSGFLQRLAWTSNNHRIALLIHGILVRQNGKDINFWWPPFWEKFAARLKTQRSYPMVDTISLITKLLAPNPDLRPFQPPRSKVVERHYHENLTEVETQPSDAQISVYRPVKTHVRGKKKDMSTERLRNKQIERLKLGLKLLGKATEVSDRQAISIVTEFTVVLANKQGYLTARDLATLTSVIMRTLDQGRCGSTERFKWYLGIIYRFLGEDACVQVGLILKRRRDANWLIWRKRLARTMEIARQTRRFTRQLIQTKGPKYSILKTMWAGYVNSGRRKAWRIRKLEAPMRLHRRALIALCRSRVDVSKTVKKIESKVADAPLEQPRAKEGGPTLPVTQGEGGFNIVLKQTHQGKTGQGVSC